jgi:murein DD-endopeptidase MepM/ murein hydrolase activator NlpD
MIATAALACDGGTAPADGTPASVSLDRTALELFEGETETLVATVANAAGGSLPVEVTWSSTQPFVATVDGAGRVSAVSPGTTEIEASVGTLAAQANVTVSSTMDFAFPLGGVLNTDFFYVFYVDLDEGPGIRDYECGGKSYNGHLGTDLTLPSFARMDQGVTVLAAAPGRVIQVVDGIFDRSTSNGPGGFGNHVRIEHQHGFVSIYGHMALGSIEVQAGDLVTSGQALGRVGSSGNSDMPHLHIEFRRDGATVDAFDGSCGGGVEHWAAPDGYQRTRALIQSGTTDVLPTLDLVKLPLVQKDTFRTDDARVAAWVHLADVEAGAVSRFVLLDPDGATFWESAFTHSQFFGMSWWWVYHVIPGWITEVGTWTMQYYNGGELLVTHAFEVVAGSASPVLVGPGPASREERGGFGGGGLGERR